MLDGIAQITAQLWRQLYPERQLYLRSNGRVRYAMLRPWAQAAASVFFLFCLISTVLASVNLILSKEMLAARDKQIITLRASNNSLLAEMTALRQRSQITSLDRQPERQQAAQLDAQTVTAALPGQTEKPRSEIQPRPRPEVRPDDISASRSQAMPRPRPRHLAFVLPPNMTATRDAFDAPQPAPAQQDVIGYLAADANTAIVALEKLINQTGLDADTMLRRLDKVTPGTRAHGGPLLTLPTSMTGNIHRGDHGEPWPPNSRTGRLQMLREALFALPLAEPVGKYYVSSGYGYRTDPFTHAKAFHSGVDMVAPHGDPVRASAPGTVIFAARNGPYGNMVEIDHGNGVKSRYGHLSKITVKQGQKVGLRDLIGLVGNTGRSGAAHLHFEVWFDGKARNPRNFLKAGENVFQRQG